MVVQRGLVHLVLRLHFQLVAVQDAEHLIWGQLAVGGQAREAADVLQQVGVHLGAQLVQAIHVGQLLHLQEVVVVQPGEEEVAAEADYLLNLKCTHTHTHTHTHTQKHTHKKLRHTLPLYLKQVNSLL